MHRKVVLHVVVESLATTRGVEVDQSVNPPSIRRYGVCRVLLVLLEVQVFLLEFVQVLRSTVLVQVLEYHWYSTPL